MWNALLYEQAVALLKSLIATPSFSKEEHQTALHLEHFLQRQQIPYERYLNNVWARNRHFDPSKPTILLNSHHDTVKPNPQYSRDPFDPAIVDGKLYGLGSNDAGGCAVSLLAAFCHFYEATNLRYNLIVAITAEEEISGRQGIESILDRLGPLEVAIVGEPTQTQLAIAEKGLLVLDGAWQSGARGA
jgi:acetylornithine deacetylase/succinyl-diaminopimelate desuccinylase-like protein